MGTVNFSGDEADNKEALNRFDAVRIVYNALINIYQEDNEPNAHDIAMELSDYPSCRICTDPFENEIGQCMAKGIITGRPGPVFDGEALLTRAEASVIIPRTIEPSLRVIPENKVTD